MQGFGYEELIRILTEQKETDNAQTQGAYTTTQLKKLTHKSITVIRARLSELISQGKVECVKVTVETIAGHNTTTNGYRYIRERKHVTTDKQATRQCIP